MKKAEVQVGIKGQRGAYKVSPLRVVVAEDVEKFGNTILRPAPLQVVRMKVGAHHMPISHSSCKA